MQVLALIPAALLAAFSFRLWQSRQRELQISKEAYDEGDYGDGRCFRELAGNSLFGVIFFGALALACAGAACAGERPMYKWEAVRAAPKHHEFGNLPSLEAAKVVAGAAKVRLGPAHTKVTITTPAGEVYVARVDQRTITWEKEG